MGSVFLFLLILFGIGGYKYYEMKKRKEEQRNAERKARLERENGKRLKSTAFWLSSRERRPNRTIWRLSSRSTSIQ